MGPKPKTLAERFWPNVDRPDGPDACWPWLRARDRDGYGWIITGSTVDGSRCSQRCHRVAFELTYPGTTQDCHVLHHCDNPCCCNPSHLFLGTHADNMADKSRKGRASSLKGESVPNAVLTDSLVRQIRRIYREGKLSQRRVGVLLGLNPNTVKSVLTGNRWVHIS